MRARLESVSVASKGKASFNTSGVEDFSHAHRYHVSRLIFLEPKRTGRCTVVTKRYTHCDHVEFLTPLFADSPPGNRRQRKTGHSVPSRLARGPPAGERNEVPEMMPVGGELFGHPAGRSRLGVQRGLKSLWLLSALSSYSAA